MRTAASSAKACPKLRSDPKHGTWGYYLSHGSDPKTGQRQQFRKTAFATKREAASVAELKTRLDKVTYMKPTTRTLGEYALDWLPGVSGPTRVSDRPRWPVMSTTSERTSLRLLWAE